MKEAAAAQKHLVTGPRHTVLTYIFTDTQSSAPCLNREITAK